MKTDRSAIANTRIFWLAMVLVFAGLLLMFRKPEDIVNRNAALIFFNDALSNSPTNMHVRISKVEVAKALFKGEVRQSSVSQLSTQLDLSQDNVTLAEVIRIGDHHLMRLGNVRVAESWYHYAVQSYPGSGATWYRLARVYEMQSKIQEAIDAYWQSINSDALPEFVVGKSDPYCRLGALRREHESVRDLFQARSDLELALQLDGFGSGAAKADCYFELANTLRWQNSPVDQYKELYSSAVRADPNHVAAHIMLGVATFESTGDVRASEQYLRQSLEIQPTVRAYQELAKIYESIEDYDTAIINYKEALNIAETNQAVPQIKAAITRLQELKGSEDDAAVP